MVNSLSNYGQLIALYQDATNLTAITGTLANPGAGSQGGILQVGSELHLYTSASTLDKDADNQSITEASGGGYAAKTGLAGLSSGSGAWTIQLNGTNVEIQLDDQVWTASGGSIANIAGAYLTDDDDNVIAWWERSSAVTLNDGDSITADDLIIRLT